LRAANFAEPPHGAWYTVRNRAEGTNESRPLRVGRLFHNHRPTCLAQSKQHLRRRRELRYRLHQRLRHAFRSAPRGCFLRSRSTPGCPPTCTSRRSAGCHLVTPDSPPRRVH